MRTTVAAGAALTLALTACGTASEEPAAPAPPPSAVEPSSSGSASPSAAGQGAGGDLAAITAGEHKFLIHLAEPDRDLSASYEGPVTTGDGTDDGALFRLLPAIGGQYLVEALRPREEGGRWCMIVDNGTSPRSLGTAECTDNEKTRFALVPTGGVDDKNRPTHHLVNDEFGAVQYSGERQQLFVGEAADADPVSLVDRGAV